MKNGNAKTSSTNSRPYPDANGLSRPELDIQLYAGLSITGNVGAVYSVEYATDVAQENDWQCLTFLRLPARKYLWLDPSAPATGQRFYRAAPSGAYTNLIFVSPGTFRMGSPADEVGRRNETDPASPHTEGPQTEVTISRGFWLGKYEVTQREYLGVMGKNPSAFKGDLNRPVENVSWFNATDYCGRLTQQERAAGRIPAGSHFRLPTEAEWEYACRAWSSTRFSFGNDPDDSDLTNYA